MASPVTDRAATSLVLGGDIPNPHAANGIIEASNGRFNSRGCIACIARKEEWCGPASSAIQIDVIERMVLSLDTDERSQLMEAAYRLRSSSSSLHQLKGEAQLLTEDVIRGAGGCEVCEEVFCAHACTRVRRVTC